MSDEEIKLVKFCLGNRYSKIDIKCPKCNQHLYKDEFATMTTYLCKNCSYIQIKES